MTNLESVMQLYTAYFNRVADAAGVEYWLNEMNNNGWSIDDVANTFSQQTEYSDLYSGLSNTQIVEKVYQNVLNRDGEAAGVEYWSGEWDNGNISVTQLVQAVVTSATEKDDNGNYVNNTDATIFINKIEVSNYAYENNINATGSEAISLADITTEVSSITALQNQASAFITIEDTVVDVSQSAIYHKSWSIQDTDYYEIGGNLLFEINYDTSDGNPAYYLSNYTVDGNTYSLTGLSGDNMDITINNLSLGRQMNVFIPDENYSESATITSVGELELLGTQSADLFEITGLNAQGYVESDNSHYMNNGMNLKLFPNDYKVYDLNSSYEVVGAGTVKNDTIYLAFEYEEGSLELVTYNNNNNTAEFYFLGDLLV